MVLTLRFVAACAAVLLAGGPAVAQLPVAPEPHLALDELVKEYKRLGLPLPPPNAELVRLKWTPDTPPCLGFQLPPAKPGDDPQHLIGVRAYRYPPGERVKNGAEALRDVEPTWVADLLCTTAQCRVLGLNEIAEALYARGLEATAKPMPPKWGSGMNQFGTYKYRVNGWQLHVEGNNRSAHLELRHAAFGYWHGKIMAPGSDRKEVLRYLQAADLGFHPDVRDLERTVAPRKSKPGTAEALIDDLTEYQSRDRGFGRPSLDDQHPSEAAYWKLAEMGFDAIPALLDHLHDSRFTRQATGDGNYLVGDEWRLSSPTHVGQLARYLVGHFTGDGVIFGIYPDPRVDAVHAWWEKARKVGEEKWLMSIVLPEVRNDVTAWLGPDRVILRRLGVKYPNRLAEVYRTVLGKRPEVGSRALAFEIVASKLTRTEKLPLLVEGAEHKRLVHRNAALAALATLDPPLFQKHLLATLKKLPPDVEKVGGLWYPHPRLAALVRKTGDPACWDALAALTKQSGVEIRLEIIQTLSEPELPDDKSQRREVLRFLMQFLSDDSVISGDEDQPRERVSDAAITALAAQLGFELNPYTERSPLSRFFLRVVVAKAAAEELERLKK